MSFYSEQVDQMINSNTSGVQLHIVTNLAPTPQANVIIVHGLAEYAGRFDPLASYLVQHNCNVFRYDQIGHGKSDGKRGFMKSPNDLYENLKIIVGRVKHDYPNLPLFVIGHSMGGETVLLYTAKYPGTVDGLVVTDPVSIIKGPSSLTVPMDGDEETEFTNQIKGGLDCDRRVVDKYINNDQVLHTLTVGIMNNAIWQGALYLREHLENITDPILYLQGLKDGLINYQDSLTAYTKINSVDKELHVYPFLMHEILNETSRKWEIYDEILRWINKHRY
ncbi:alpha/beta hydrolase [Limosilactobacillus reuteri]|uniref:Alpha/beta hydrolase n=1 Tax=Limosilactobacillus reuteri TaxID=1598 RepID=A0A855X8E6_LIMRT|nr:alpha/beta hydrolase [Limosilactobacillus reuteri]PWT34155.1 alpha/beta hydrolase [Limosilactobacillus reuteri]PWT38871.1 alpha/beta hydrolase [Limosilactobacillus reuteri]PWT45587.1 alpha/beta hydrolase [Limosilactobacillus reuteri]PWT56999.1 alpha/beta hydrolase [Limosilactobacillus reuteri]PWT68068.1 alpha/beta hydrolase [Limosilactobacillus reuteri]